MDLKTLRLKIDELDASIMEKLNERFNLMAEIGCIKRMNQLPIDDEKREMAILAKTINFPYSYSLSNVYHQIMIESKHLQTMLTYLVGGDLSYSYSDDIHHYLGNPYYLLYETSDLNEFFQNNYFFGLNITNPYKRTVLKYVNSKSNIVESTGVTNFLIKQNNLIHAENLDYDAFIEMLSLYQYDVANKKAIIVGNGATSKTIALALKDLGIKHFVKLVRTIKSENEYLLADYLQYKDYDLIINTTSFGVKPYYEADFLFPLNEFTNLSAVIDVNYNPYRTPLIQEALNYNFNFQKKVKTISGLSMLVASSRIAEARWMNKDESAFKSTIDITKHLLEEKLNIVLIGMPYSGKTTIGKKLGLLFKRPFIDSDHVLKKRSQSLEDFASKSDFINAFRNAETEVIKEIISNEGYIISTGGGVIEREINIKFLQQTGIIIYLNTPLNILAKRLDGTRPLIDSVDTLKMFYQRRHSLYLKYADIVITSENNIIEELLVKLHEYFNNQWS